MKSIATMALLFQIFDPVIFGKIINILYWLKILKPFDILLFNTTREVRGAHFGLYLGSNKVLHLSKVIGFPVIWDLKEFANHKKYKIFIGAKRLKKSNKIFNPNYI